MQKLIIILLSITTPILTFGQYPIIEEFNSFGGVGEWTVDNGGGVQNYGGAENYATFNIGGTPYLNSTTHTMSSPTYNLTDCGNGIEVSFPISGLIQNGFDFFYFDYFDGGIWNNAVTYTGIQNLTYINTTIPNTTTQFRMVLITNPSFIIWYRNNGNWWFFNVGSYNNPVDISNSYVNGVNPITIGIYYYDITRFTIDCPSPLPIELVMFDCRVDDDDIELFWSTASQINNDYFIIEHSLDGNAWNDIAYVTGAGNSSQLLEYSTTHLNAPVGINYYRLTQVDFDGNSETFNIINCSIYLNDPPVDNIKYFNNLGQEINKPLEGYYLEVITYVDGSKRVNKKFIILN